jgi:hypothetical protein
MWDTIEQQTSGGNGASESAACLAKANEQALPLEARIADLRNNWKTTGFYSPAQVQSVLEEIHDVRTRAWAMLDKVTHQGNDNIYSARTDLNEVGAEANRYAAKVVEAKQKNIAQIDAPGLRSFVLNALTKCADATVAASYVSCMEPWWVSAMVVFQKVFDWATRIIMAIPGIVLDAARALLKIPDMISTIVKVTVIAGAAWLAYTLYTSGRS